ncbi:MAG: hypothetical protein ACRELG_05700 [Gemmataceae bacterium]
MPGFISCSSGNSWYFRAGFGAAIGCTVIRMTFSLGASAARTASDGSSKTQTASVRHMEILLDGRN